MTVTRSTRDADARTLTVTAEFDAPPARVWNLWADPRLLERWWGPPTWPATFTEHDLRPGGRSRYVMHGPDGGTSPGWWRTVSVDPPHHFAFENGFAGPTGEPDPTMPVMMIRLAIEERAGSGTRMTVVIAFSSSADMEQVLTMGMEEGMSAAMGQMDMVL
jgi:uncharacterized protein YndB with AHSA1/START domain